VPNSPLIVQTNCETNLNLTKALVTNRDLNPTKMTKKKKQPKKKQTAHNKQTRKK
jgi:hypothetical protein